MPNVTHLAAYRHRDTIAVLRHALRRAERGEIGGINLVLEDLTAGENLVSYTGSFRKDPGGLGAFLGRLAVRLCSIADGAESQDMYLG